jgi:hypothetical protein
LKDIPFVDQEFVDNWLKKEDKIPKKWKLVVMVIFSKDIYLMYRKNLTKTFKFFIVVDFSPRWHYLFSISIIYLLMYRREQSSESATFLQRNVWSTTPPPSSYALPASISLQDGGYVTREYCACLQDGIITVCTKLFIKISTRPSKNEIMLYTLKFKLHSKETELLRHLEICIVLCTCKNID